MSSEARKIEDKYHTRAVIAQVKDIKKNIKERAKQAEPPKRAAPQVTPPERPTSPAPMSPVPVLVAHKLNVRKSSHTVNKSSVSNNVTPPPTRPKSTKY